MLKDKVSKANKKLVELGLVKLGFGNVSARDGDYIWIKPSGKSEGAVKVKIVDNSYDKKGLKPSVDTLIHIELYFRFPKIGAIVHTHSSYATSFAQDNIGIECYGTTHADCFKGSIPCIPFLKKVEIIKDYESNIGRSIINYFVKNKINPLEILGCLLAGHGVFVWGKDIDEAMYNAEAIEEIAKIARLSNGWPLPRCLIEKHFNRKHGRGAYYGQNNP